MARRRRPGSNEVGTEADRCLEWDAGCRGRAPRRTRLPGSQARVDGGAKKRDLAYMFM